jgi:hypothetical protein
MASATCLPGDSEPGYTRVGSGGFRRNKTVDIWVTHYAPHPSPDYPYQESRAGARSGVGSFLNCCHMLLSISATKKYAANRIRNARFERIGKRGETRGDD